MSRFFFSFLFLSASVILLSAFSRRSRRVVISNDSGRQRTEIVEVNVADLNLKHPDCFSLVGPDGVAAQTQLSSDGHMLLLFATVPPHSSVRYVVADGVRSVSDTVACGRLHPERLDDLAWENDRIGFRAYGPAFRAMNYKSFGFDVMVKRVTRPVFDHRYALMFNPLTLAAIDSLKRVNRDSARSLESSVSYHVDHGDGLDCYAVGQSLGCCATAIVDSRGSLCFSNCFSECTIVDNGPLRFSARLTFGPIVVDSDSVFEDRTIVLDAGSNLNRSSVSYRGASRPLVVALGPVLHHPLAASRVVCSPDSSYLSYVDPTDQPRNDCGQIFVGAVFTAKPDSAVLTPFTSVQAKACRGAYGHNLAFFHVPVSGCLDYLWGAGWSRWGADSFDSWNSYLASVSANILSPLSVSIE